MGSNKPDREKRNDFNVNQEDQNELSLAISKAVTQVLESSDWRSLSFPLDANAGRRAKVKNSVKRPMNAFMLYAQAARKKLSHLYPDLSYAKLSKTLGRIWKSLDDGEKQPFVHEAERLRQKHKLDYPDYKFQPKRKEKRRSQSPNKEPFEHGKISTGDVLKVLSSSGTPGNVVKHESQDLWAQNIHNGLHAPPAVIALQTNLSRDVIGGHDASSQPPSYSTTRINPPMVRRMFPTTTSADVQPKISRNSPIPQYAPSTISQRPLATTGVSNTPFQARYFSPPPLQRSSTAGLFTPTSYRVAKGPQTNSTIYSQGNDFHHLSAGSPTFPYDLPLHAIANSFPKCPPSSMSTQPPPLTSSQGGMNQTTNLLTGVNQILRDMFGNDKNSIV